MKTPIQEIAYFYNDIIDFSELINFSQRLWPEELNRYEASLKVEDTDVDDRFNNRTDLYGKLSTEFPQLQRRSYLVMLLALFEDFLNQLSDSIKEDENIVDNPFDIDGKGIDRAKKYISKFSKINFPSNSKEWQNIKKAQSIRNLIIHAGGHIDLDKKIKELKIISENKNLDIEYFARTHITIEQSYLTDLISDLLNFSNYLTHEYQ
ncbi:hypothetical protein [Marinicellulosiphila megalodicopiae]|uniref:hypothetical protein n=1 Tax=Marinicellulosiphila megalodicopiae TaxID=2724896 RepID=UPI003BAE8154